MMSQPHWGSFFCLRCGGFTKEKVGRNLRLACPGAPTCEVVRTAIRRHERGLAPRAHHVVAPAVKGCMDGAPVSLGRKRGVQPGVGVNAGTRNSRGRRRVEDEGERGGDAFPLPCDSGTSSACGQRPEEREEPTRGAPMSGGHQAKRRKTTLDEAEVGGFEESMD